MNIDLVKNFIANYKPGDNLKKPDNEILEFGKKMLPKEIVYLWENYGFGNYGNGIIKLVDPRDYMNSLYSWLGEKDFNKIPIMMSAFGDIFYYRNLENNENDVSLLDIHYRQIDVCAYSYQDFFNDYIINGEIKKNVLILTQFPQNATLIHQKTPVISARGVLQPGTRFVDTVIACTFF